MIRVAFRYGDKRIFARGVCLLQGGDSAHCEVAVAWNQNWHECISSSFLDKGVRRKNIELVPSKWRVYEMDVSVAVAEKWYAQNKGAGYDLLGLAGFVIRRIKGWMKKKFCSECGAEIIGLPDPWRYDLALLESVCARFGRRVY